ncbi:MAG: DUF3990 domain-containing protein [Roseburia sp.]|nr:DUF3990 domain-containing protein [Roseburia sp.]
MEKPETEKEAMHIVNANETVTLYHGSKSGICGAVAPVSRAHCDFGRGFYMGTNRMQPLTLICNYPKAKIYTLSVDLSELKVLDTGAGLDWALLIAYNRGKMAAVKNSQICDRLAKISSGRDMIIGPIANDRMFVVLDRFFNGEITDLALINSLSALELGRQYAALTEKACRKIKILEEQELSDNNRFELKRESERNRSKGIAMADEICRKYRREGRFFDEILKMGGSYGSFDT